jgi:hypothetical protein
MARAIAAQSRGNHARAGSLSAAEPERPGLGRGSAAGPPEISRRTSCQSASDPAVPARPAPLPTTWVGPPVSGWPSPPPAGRGQAPASRPPGPRPPGEPRERSDRSARHARRAARRVSRSASAGSGGLYVAWQARSCPDEGFFRPVMTHSPVAVAAHDVSRGRFGWLVLPPPGRLPCPRQCDNRAQGAARRDPQAYGGQLRPESGGQAGTRPHYDRSADDYHAAQQPEHDPHAASSPPAGRFPAGRGWLTPVMTGPGPRR